MQSRTLERRLQGRVEVDVCFGCRAFWFDSYESSQLAPAAVIELFRAIHEAGGEPQRPLGGAMRCPRCRGLLQLTHDLQRTTRITYYRCTEGHGRLTTFYQFLREKQFVRELSPAEVEGLRAKVGQVRCAGCGAPIDLARDAACSYCHMPLAVLDADAVRTTLAELAADEKRRHEVDPAAAIGAMAAAGRMEHRLARYEAGASWVAGPDLGGVGDLVSGAIDFLMTD
jgi:Zn-finger nucleic acid-binding protein